MSTVSKPHRRIFLAGGIATAAAAVTGCTSTAHSDTPAVQTPSGTAIASSPSANARPDSARSALDRLTEGNKRWIKGALRHPDQDPQRRQAVAEEQKPYGVVLSCIDSRVPPELVFDTGIGDLFVIRTGGQVVAPIVTGSVEYGPMTAGTPLIVVLGHQRCGAIKAAHKALKDNTPLPGNLQSIAEALLPAYKAVSQQKHADPVDAMIRVHVEQTAAALRANAGLAPMMKKGNLAVVGAYYSLDTGRVEILSGTPTG